MELEPGSQLRDYLEREYTSASRMKLSLAPTQETPQSSGTAPRSLSQRRRGPKKAGRRQVPELRRKCQSAARSGKEPGHRRIAGQGEDDQQVSGPGFRGGGQQRPRPRSAQDAGFGIDIEGGWVPTYRQLADATDRKDVLAELKKQAAAAGMVYLAPDPDREGEAIAWHLKEALGLDDERIRRVTFNEITKTAVQKAFATAGEHRHGPRRRPGSPPLPRPRRGLPAQPAAQRKKLARELSAGRVQSVAVRLIVEREREIEAFKPEEYWKITALLAPQGRCRLPQAAAAKSPSRKRQGPRLPRPTTKERAGSRPAEAALPGKALPGRAGRVGRQEVRGRQPRTRRSRSSTALRRRAYTSSPRSSRRTARKRPRRRSPPARCSSRPASACASRPSEP